MPGQIRGIAEEDLIERVRSGDTAAFEVLFREFYPRLFNATVSYLRSTEAAQDLVNDIFSRLWSNRKNWNPVGGVAGYLYMAVRNNALNILKHHKIAEREHARMEVAGEVAGLGEYADSNNVSFATDRAELWAAVDSLPENWRMVLVLRWREQLDWASIAAALGLSVSAAKMQHSRALKGLKERLSPNFF